jgi:HPt (histidine-containing phosphotransfer) domain-containing protein
MEQGETFIDGTHIAACHEICTEHSAVLQQKRNFMNSQYIETDGYEAAIAISNRSMPSPSAKQEPVDLQQLLEAAGDCQDEARALAGLYLSETNKMIRQLDDAVLHFSIHEIERLAHKLAGASASCGITALLPSLSELEHSARSRQLQAPQAQQLYQTTLHQFHRAETFLVSNGLV